MLVVIVRQIPGYNARTVRTIGARQKAAYRELGTFSNQAGVTAGGGREAGGARLGVKPLAQLAGKLAFERDDYGTADYRQAKQDQPWPNER